MASNILNLSDEETLNMGADELEALIAQAEADAPAGTAPGDSNDPGETSGGEAVQGDAAVAGDEGAEATNAAAAALDKDDGENAPAPAAVTGDKPATVVSPAEAGKETPPVDPKVAPVTESTVDFEAAYKKLTAPFMANGREISVENVDDAIALMQMGANYNKKMAALKPNLKLLKLLESGGLLSEEKIGFLIDLEQKKPDAINKLIKDSGLDPMDLDADKAGNYKPTHRAVDDREIELDSVLEEIQSTKSYQRTMSVVAQEWDDKSKQTVANAPQLLKVINGHIETGVFDVIRAEVDRERVFGRLNGLSDIEAYRQVGDAINARGGFAHLSTQGQQTPPPKQVVTPNPKKVDEDKLKEKRRAASPSKPAVGSAPLKDFNPLGMSDAEIAKMGSPQFM